MIKTIKQVFVTIWLLTMCFVLRAQVPTTLELAQCQELAVTHYPLVKQHELIAKSRDHSIENALKGYLPQFNVNGQATYQSAVTEIPIAAPGMEVPQLSKDQYKIYAEVSQSLWDGGQIKHQKSLIQANSNIKEKALAVTLYQIKERINQLFFGILTIDEQLNINNLLEKDLAIGLTRTKAAVENGSALRSNVDMIQAELLKANQREIELKASRMAYLEMLSLFINQPVDERTILVKPDPVIPSTEINRPELRLFDARVAGLDAQETSIDTKLLPKVDFFFQGGYGRPALNIFEPGFEPYYIGGARFRWNLAGLYTNKKERALLSIERKNIDLEKETFLFNTDFQLKEQHANISKYQALLLADEEIIMLRSRIKNTSLVQLENGVIRTSDYLREVHAEDQARLNKIIHEIQLLSGLYAIQTTTGI